MIGGGRRRMRDTIKPCPVVWSWLWSGGAGGTGGGGGGGAFAQRHLRLRRGASWGETPHPPPFPPGAAARCMLRKEAGADKPRTLWGEPVRPTTAADVRAPSERPGFRREYTVCRRATKAYRGARWRTHAYGGANGGERGACSTSG